MQLDAGAQEWRSGPDIPLGLMYTAIVQDQDGGVVLIGGGSSQGLSDTLFRLPHAGANAVWEELPQKLKTGRQGPIAFLIPDDITNCTLN